MRLRFPNTLAARLFLYSSLTAIAGVLVIAFVISADYRRTAEERLRELLVANIFNLMSTFDVNRDGKLIGMPELGDARYSLFDSGWYWSVHEVGNSDNRISSLSLVERRIEVPASAEFDASFQRMFENTDDVGQMLLGMETQVFLGEGDNLYSFRITANRSAINEEIAAFRNRLSLILAIFAFSIVLATYAAVKLGLKPINNAIKILADIRNGNASTIEGTYPDEIQPFITETNALIDSNRTIVERARTQVGNLAHSLKTPLAVMQNELPMIKGRRGQLFGEQLKTMRQQVQVYLDRARISARSATALARTPVVPVLEKLVEVIGKLSPDLVLEFRHKGKGVPVFEGEEHDFQEIMGNLLENASKYASSKVLIELVADEAAITVRVDDDGPGMSAGDMEKARERGARVDEAQAGWGLGLSIIQDIVDEYDGSFDLDRSEMGGLQARVILPGHIRH